MANVIHREEKITRKGEQMSKRKIVQIAVPPNDHSQTIKILALTENGEVWELRPADYGKSHNWKKLPDLPPDEECDEVKE